MADKVQKQQEGEVQKVTDRKATVIASEMAEEMMLTAVELCNQALDKCKEGTTNQEREVAKHVKENFDKQYGAAWHAAFGSNLGCHMTYEAGKVLFLSIGAHNLVLWKHM
uniref:Dynein light chain n=1 Tax=Eutreptiella gymnastica TaxID=73025 RepID=A0A7S1J0L9_9EUGL|mmetsp:Transcript_58225/g.103882  ORF Transcript_58225/g.103882 Transcript_58225/m.103882 type:complete len:110 (+) Transcript_58225:130-459(+)